jgi:hypothetical protein
MTATSREREQLVSELASAWSSSLSMVEPQKLNMTLRIYSFLNNAGPDLSARLAELVLACEKVINLAMPKHGSKSDADLCAMLLGLGEYSTVPRGERYRVAGAYAKKLPRAMERNIYVSDHDYYIGYVRKVDGRNAMRRLLIHLQEFDVESKASLEAGILEFRSWGVDPRFESSEYKVFPFFPNDDRFQSCVSHG